MKIGGIHILLDFSDCKTDMADKNFLTSLIYQIAQFCDLNISNTISRQYKPQGVSIMALIPEGHIALHPQAKTNSLLCDIYTPDKNIKYLQLKKFLEKELQGQSTMALIKRGEGKIKIILED